MFGYMTLFKLCKPYRNKQMVTYLVDNLNPRGIDNWHQFKIQENSHAHFGWIIILSYVIDTKLDARGEKGEVVGGVFVTFQVYQTERTKGNFGLGIKQQYFTLDICQGRTR